ncbi:homeobox-leucine zipper protein HDG11-like [Arachis hypogaea]|uniref:homeobox-leucine zipper protein HDG11-like n=1 Tax=Arachis hypogaea TaxID=3818 RepID=UPI000DED2D5D|nr:homeobox-leucine zipper protein HDG11-like [Arachis hypogaea]
MSSSVTGAAGSGDDGRSSNNKGKRPAYKRLTSAQTAKLEKYIIDCPHPDEAQRRQLAEEVGIEPKQVKFWFQNKRTQIKNQHERADNNALRAENERIQNENLLMKEALNNILCPSCGGPPAAGEDHEHFMQKMLLENAHLKEEASLNSFNTSSFQHVSHGKISNILSRYLEKEVLHPEDIEQLNAIPNSIDIAGSSSTTPLYDFSVANGTLLNQQQGVSINDVVAGPSSSLLHHQNYVPPPIVADNNDNGEQGVAVMEVALASEVAATAMDELLRLIRLNEPFWVGSAFDGKLVLHGESYEKMFPRVYQFNDGNSRVESSKESGIVNISGIQLVDLFLDSEKWVNAFPTIVTKAQTLEVFEIGLPESRSGALQLMYEEMHGFSPLVASREFQFLRQCHQLEPGSWIITDVSFDSLRNYPFRLPRSRSWRRPSGCLIQELPNSTSCMVTWIEHVEVDDKIQTHRLYRDLVSTNAAYGAQRWIMELQRMCHRSMSYALENIPDHEYGGVINRNEGRRSVMRLGHRLVRLFSENLNMSGKVEFPQLSVEYNSGVRISARRCTEKGQPNGTIVIAATSLWLPLHYHTVFEFLTDINKRSQWDVLFCTTPVHYIAHISNGTHPANNTSIIQPFMSSENNAVIIQESFIDPVGSSYIVYAPVDVEAINVAISGDDSSTIPILPSGFVVCGDGRASMMSNSTTIIAPSVLGGVGSYGYQHRSEGGSLLTVAFQILVNTITCGPNLVNMESVDSINTLLTSTVQKIKDALNCNALH